MGSGPWWDGAPKEKRAMDHDTKPRVKLPNVTLQKPTTMWIKGDGDFWHPVDHDGRIYEAMKYDDEAVMRQFRKGVLACFFPAKE